MRRHSKPSFKGIGRTSGAIIGAIAVKVYVCHGCGVQHKGVERGGKFTAPLQCMDCGRMDFATFDSMGEATRWAELLLKVRAGMITELQRQVRYDLLAHRSDGAAVKVGQYIADFVYQRDGAKVIEDFKGAITDVAALKLRWMAAMGMPVTIITTKGKHYG